VPSVSPSARRAVQAAALSRRAPATGRRLCGRWFLRAGNFCMNVAEGLRALCLAQREACCEGSGAVTESAGHGPAPMRPLVPARAGNFCMNVAEGLRALRLWGTTSGGLEAPRYDSCWHFQDAAFSLAVPGVSSRYHSKGDGGACASADLQPRAVNASACRRGRSTDPGGPGRWH